MTIRQGSGQLAEQLVSLALELSPLPPQLLDVPLEPGHVGRGLSGVRTVEGVVADECIPLGIVVEMPVHIELTDGELLGALQRLDLVVQAKDAILEPAHGTYGSR